MGYACCQLADGSELFLLNELLLGAFQVHHHRVEGLSQGSHLQGSVEGNSHRPVPQRHLPGGLGQIAERPCDRPSERNGDEYRQKDRGAGDQGHLPPEGQQQLLECSHFGADIEDTHDVVLVIEPDTFVFSANDTEMLAILDETCGIIADHADNAAVFLDIGHSGWLNAAGVHELVSAYNNLDKIDGWASNTSNFQPMDVEEIFAAELFDLTGKPVIVDTSRNGCGVCYDDYHLA